ncbi:MAG: hypothetical protein ACO20H_12920 [Bacteriovoracaceae bacterium]
MKSFLFSILFLVTLTINIAKAADYVLICKGGRLVNITWQFPSNSGTYTIEDFDIVFGFSKSPVKADYPYSNMPEGSCAWTDRPLNTNELSSLVIRKAPFIGKMSFNARSKKIINLEPALDVGVSDHQAKVKMLKLYMKRAGNNQGILKFRAKSMPGSDKRLQITRLGI